MSGYKELEIYRIAFNLSIKVHHTSMKLPKFELFEQGSQIRRSSKAEYIKYLIYAQASCDETLNHLETLVLLYPDIQDFLDMISEYNVLGKKINNYILWVENNWNA
jgi:hypothetical protein